MTDKDNARAGRPAGANGKRPLIAALLLAVAALAVAGLFVFLVRKGGDAADLLLPGVAVLVVMFLLGLLAGRQFGGLSDTGLLPQQMADGTGDAMVVADDRGRVLHANTAFVQLVSKAGQSRVTGMDVLYAGYPDFAEPIYQLAQASAAGRSLSRDVRVPANSSVPGASAEGARWLRLSVSPLAAASGRRSLWRLSDITADRQGQETAFARLQYIITYLDHAPAGFFSILPDGRVDYINATLAEWLGLDLAAPQTDKMPLARLVGDEAARHMMSVQGGANVSHVDRFTAQLPKGSGRVAADIIFRSDFDSDGKPLPSRAMVMLKQEPERMAAAANWFDLLAVASPIGVAVLTKTGELRRANSTFLGLSAELKLHGAVLNAVRETDRPAYSAALEAALARPGTPASCEVTLDNQPPRAVQMSLCQVGDTLAAFALDRTEARALEVQLAQSQKMQAVGQLASGIAHDFNNVLTPIIGFADLLLTKMRPTDAAFADIMNIKQNANRAANLVRQLLAFSRKQTMQPRVTLLSEAMSDLGNLLGRVLGEKIGFDINHERDLGYVLVDFNQFEQVVINLAVNARDAMPHGGRLSVKTYNVSKAQSQNGKHKLPEAEYVVCEVADTGTGIPKEILEKIWEPFFSTKEVGKGTGLGLSMVYGIVKQTGGFIYCDSEVGKGTTFTIYLPRHYPQPAAVPPPAAEKVEAPRADFTGRGRILVVEDEDSVRAFAVRALTSRGYTVVEADSGERGLEVIDEDKEGFEVILSDVVMPEMDGPTMLAEIRKRGITSKFIFMSGYAEDAFERNLENPDDFAFIQKPFTLKQLVEKVKEVMG
ncbi:ATP-binding protein [Aestuariivirga sp.]|uniref:ATP-binding protein n=1 Tax=Aestuariivirga sp. TaxID=2650926 RepID=UPI0039E40C9F